MADDLYAQFGVSPKDYFIDPETNTIKRKELALPTIPELPDNRLIDDFQVSAGSKIGNKLFGTGGEERYQTWPERMIRSGSTIAGDVYSGAVPIESPTGYPGSVLPVETQMEPNIVGKTLGIGNFSVPAPTSEIGRVQDMAGLAGMSTIGIKPGTASVASAIVREDSKPATALAALKSKSEQFGLTEVEYLKQLPANEQLKIFDELDARNAKLSPTEKMHYNYLESKLGELEAGTQPKQNLAINQIEQTLRSDFAKILPEFKTIEDVVTAKKHNPNFKETVKGLTDEEAFQAIQNANDPNFKPIKLDNGLTLVPVRHNPFAELETGIREAAKNIVRDEPLPPNTAIQNLINKRIELLQKQLEHVKDYKEENVIYDKIRELRDRRRETEGHDSPTTNEFSKITDYALEYADRVNPKGREKRAVAQGFEDTAYHGAKDEWLTLDVKAPRDYGFYSTANPELANMYAGDVTPWARKNVMPLKINTKEYLTVNAEGKSWTDVNDNAIARANKEGKKGVVIHNVYDEPSSGQQLGAPKTVYIALDPTTVRSKFAKFNPENIGKNGLLFEDSKVGTAIGALNQSGMYSNLERTIAGSKVQKATPEQWQSYLKNQPGVKPEELEFSLQGLGDKVLTKEQLAQHVADNGIKFNEVAKSDIPQNIKSQMDNLEEKLAKGEFGYNSKLYHEKFSELENLKNQYTKPKYSSYQLPGGENYRELLITVPNKKVDPEVFAKEFYKNWYPDKKWEDLSYPEKSNFINLANEQANSMGKHPNNYQSSHWDEPNVLAHIRMNDREVPGVGKTLHVEEIQSDWHQAGRKQGYRDEAKLAEIEAKLKPLNGELAIQNTNWNDPRRLELAAQRDALNEQWNDLNSHNQYGGPVPNAPFKKTWDELALKRVLSEAATKGYDAVSWTPGEAQAARYDLSKQVDKIAVPMVNENGTRSVRIDAKGDTPFKLMVDKNGIVDGSHSASQFSGKPLSDVVGKEMAEKILKLEKPDEFSGDGLKVGGEGMKAFYDTMLPAKANALIKKMGGKVEYVDSKAPEFAVYQRVNKVSEDFPTASAAREWAKSQGLEGKATVRESKSGNPHPMHVIKITPQMRETIANKGFPLYSSGVPTFTPVDDPFKRQPKLIPIDYNPFTNPKAM